MDSATAASAEALPDLHRQAVRLEQFSIAWMMIEAGVAVTAGIIAGSLALTSFGFDSVIELVSATLVLRRLQAELTGGRANEQAERRVLRIIAVTFFVLAAYVVIGSVVDLATQARPERSPVGIGLTVSSLLVMPLLGWRKRRVGRLLGNQLVLADAAKRSSAPPSRLPRCSGWFSSQPSAGGGPTRSPLWPSPTSRYEKAAKPGTAS